ncbi:LysE family translocator [Shewanella sp. D64]|uniref:LysE family translocator n=1 Tax=unclassified Shewanella TaxID=196818 RepID=UPI0022BA2983|nr:MULTISPECIES: LysE family translocator [unclassified Shewanella]MEC4728121.1 LysE family translocator [Shewanella sp. D64]MEC4740241.1 LysE family translocator [Shewanella sp. E94]WBJ94440.1 LysE family translocator [Shewanella sp. MTB7]
MEWLSLAVLGILIVMSPGADFVLVLRNSLNQGRRIGLWTAIGVSLAITVHISYSMLGIGYLISQNELLFTLIRYAGAGYLIYLGIIGLLSSNQAIDTSSSSSKQSTALSAMTQGFLCNLLNPKTMLFFLSIFSQLLGSEQSNQSEALIYGLYMIVLHACWFSVVAILFTSKRLQSHLNRIKQKINQACGAGLIILGIALGFKS